MQTERHNSFDAIRLFAALCVFFSHQLSFMGFPEPSLGPLGISLASTGLYIFFGLSGYLVFKSIARDPRPTRYFAARILRIFPGSVANVVFCVVLGAIVTTLPLQDFFKSLQTWAYLLHNGSIVVTPTQLELPGVLASARWPVVNGSIWTIKYELMCYVLLFVLYYAATHLKSGARLFLAGCLLVAAGSYIARITWYANPTANDFYTTYNWFNTLRFIMTFLAGAVLAITEPRREPLRVAVFSVPAVLIVFGLTPEFARAGIILLLTLLVVEVGRRPIFFSRTYSKIGDLSYGTFLYAYPIQNVIVTQYYNGSNYIVITIITLLLILLCAFLSWRFIERPSLRLKW
jgi:peptidoglycan/LPS O-acetylase OafA/YrhL